MATTATIYNEQGLRLAKLLCEIAGVESSEVRAITCRCASNEAVTFQIEKFVDEQQIKAVIDKEQT